MADTPRMGATNLAYLWEKIKNLLSNKVDKETGKGLSSNDYTSTEKTKLAGIATGAQVNVLEGIQVNGTTITPTNKIANIPAMTGASSSAAGKEGAVPKPAAGAQGKFLRGDGTWQTVATGAEVNQNAFSNVKVGSTTIAADSKTDTLELVAGSNVTLTPDATNDKVTIAATDTTYSAATQSAAGLMAAADKKKLDGVATGAEVNQNAFSKIAVSGNTTIEADSKTDTLTIASGNGIAQISTNATNDTVYITVDQTATTTDDGLMSAEDKTFLDSISADTALDAFGIATFQNGGPDTEDITDYVMVEAIDVHSPIVMRAYDGIVFEGIEIRDGVFSGVKIHGDPATANPLMDGTAAVGTSTKYARQDHVHPKDTSKANLASPTFTGTPKAPTATAGTNTTQIATTAFVKTAIDNAVAGITQFEFQTVTSLPTTGTKGVIYLVAHSHGTGDAYDEYIWTGSAYEKIGNTDIDLSAYATIASIRELTTAEMDAILV